MTVLLEPRLTSLALPCANYDPTRDKTYQATRLGRPIADHLAWCELKGLSGRTLDDRERYCAWFALMWPHLDLPAAQPDHVLHFLTRQPARSRRVRRSHLASFFQWAVLFDLLDRNPMDRVPAQKPAGQRVYDIFSDAEVDALLGLDLRDRTLMLILFQAGLRKGEARRLRLRDVREDRIVVLAGKGAKDRSIRVPPAVVQAVAELALLDGLDGRDHLWYDKPGGGRVRRAKPIVESAFDRWWRRCLADAGVRYRNPHMTRHTYATIWLRRGARLEKLSMMMGHSSIKTTWDEYGHLDQADVADDLELVFGTLDR